jgi:RNA polymerase sigma-70 factor (ECF subfamily)
MAEAVRAASSRNGASISLSLSDLLARVRQGDEAAAAAIVREYEPQIRAEARTRLAQAQLGHLVDSVDISQSVMKSFFVRATLGVWEIEHPGQIVKLLLAMCHNKLAEQIRWHHAQRRDVLRREWLGTQQLASIAGHEPPADDVAILSELQEQVSQRLSQRERLLAAARADGRTWREIADDTGDSPDAVRMQFSRAVDRVCVELGLGTVGP